MAPATRGTVHEVLTNEKYIGNNIFNRTSFKLKVHRTVNPPDMWVRANGVFQGIVEPSYFYTVQGMLRERSRRFTNDEMLEKLRALHDRQGWLSGFAINETADMPSSSAYAQRFGSLIRAYELIGYTPDRDFRYVEINRHLRHLYPGIVEGAIKRIQEHGGQVRREVTNDLLIVNEEIKVSLVICRCFQAANGSNGWKVHLDTGLMPDITIVIRMNHENTAPLDYYLLPALDIENPKIRLADHNHFALETYRFDDLEPFFVLMERAAVPEVA